MVTRVQLIIPSFIRGNALAIGCIIDSPSIASLPSSNRNNICGYSRMLDDARIQEIVGNVIIGLFILVKWL